ncbi:MAG: 4-hydroxythreonine-4-phosphate dehydrogenase PdxA [Candidatus Puniceispirillales bacterium]
MPSKRLIVTPGEPAGIGGEILLKAIEAGATRLITMDDPERLMQLAGDMGIRLRAEVVGSIPEAEALAPESLAILPIHWPEPPQPGAPTVANAPRVIDAITEAASLARSGDVLALVTNPIQKSTLYAAGFSSPGHTEYLGMLDGPQSRPVMLLHNPMLKIVPLTIHIPLAEVPAAITPQKIEETAHILEDSLRRDFGLTQPRIAITGLNPHAGEGGALGHEEEQIIAPAIASLQAQGMHASGPFSADTLFHEDRRQDYDAVIAMYHDQALIPVKTLDFHHGVNVTLGLSYIRTSPDHGTALDQAGQHNANPASLMAAIDLAFSMARRRHDHRA